MKADLDSTLDTKPYRKPSPSNEVNEHATLFKPSFEWFKHLVHQDVGVATVAKHSSA